MAAVRRWTALPNVGPQQHQSCYQEYQQLHEHELDSEYNRHTPAPSARGGGRGALSCWPRSSWRAPVLLLALLLASICCYEQAALAPTHDLSSVQVIQLILANLFFCVAIIFSFALFSFPTPAQSSPRPSSTSSKRRWLVRRMAWPAGCVVVQSAALIVLTSHVDPKQNLSAEINLILFTLSCAGTLAVTALIAALWHFCLRGHDESRGGKRHRRRGRSTTLVTVVVVVIVAATMCALAAASSARFARERWRRGLFGREMATGVDSGRCDIRAATPLIDFVPRRLLNFYVGSEDCASEGKRQFSRFEHGILTIDCAPEDSPHVVLYPSLAVDANTEERNERLQATVRALNQTRVAYNGPMAIDADYFVAVCGKEENFHVQVVPVREKRDHRRNVASAKPAPYNVVVINIDALSRNHFLRRLPETVEWFEQLHGRSTNATHQVFQFFRYHSIAGRTGPNLVPLVAGVPEAAFRRCLEGRSGLAENYDLWWRAYERDHGHVSLWVYNMCLDFFGHYLAQDGPPNAFVTHEVVLPFCHPEYSAYRTNFRGPYSLGRRCITGRPVHDLTFDVLRQFMAAYPSHRGRIAFASFMEAHEGSLAFIANVDRSLRAYLEELTSAHPYTFVLILSDHGSHMGPYFRYTAAGVLENRLPAFFMLAPQRFLQSHEEARVHLLANEQRLFTVWDLHHTLRHLARLTSGDDGQADPDGGESKGAYSLFEAIPADRDCTAAHIPAHHCACAPIGQSAQ